MTADAAFRTGFVAIVGRPNVGKSTLLNNLVGQKVSITSRKPQTTRHRINGILTTPAGQFIFVDTPGFQLKHKSAMNSVMNRTVQQVLADVDVIVWVVEAGHYGGSDRRMLEILPADKAVILVINKVDTVKDKGALLPFIDELSAVRNFAAIVPLSARSDTDMSPLIHSVVPHLPEGEALFPDDVPTDRSERFLAAELIREKLFRYLGEELPYATTVMIDRFETAKRLRRIFATIVVEKSNQKAIIIGHNGEKLKTIGTLARQDMEATFGTKVYLELWVKVRSGWSESESTLKSLGQDNL